MGLLTENGVHSVHHYTPLHYLPFIARSSALLGKPTLAASGFSPKHFRSMSSRQDVERGFGEYGFLTLDKHPRILAAKLSAGFPHVGILVPAASIEARDFALCRYNVAMTRYLKRGNKSGFEESDTNGRYYPGKQIPIAKAPEDVDSMLKKYADSETMIEVLISNDLPLPPETSIVCYSAADADLSSMVLGELGIQWKVEAKEPPGAYNRNSDYVASVERFIERALGDAAWRGDGLEFDRV